MPRARIENPEGGRREWRSQIIQRHQRRTERVSTKRFSMSTEAGLKRVGFAEPSLLLVRGLPLSNGAISVFGCRHSVDIDESTKDQAICLWAVMVVRNS